MKPQICRLFYQSTLQISKKCLNSVFTSVSEDSSLESPKGSVEISSISEVSDENQLKEESTEVISDFNLVYIMLYRVNFVFYIADESKFHLLIRFCKLFDQ